MSRKKRGNKNNMRKTRSCYRKRSNGKKNMSRKTYNMYRKRSGRRSLRARRYRGGAYDPMQLSLGQGQDFNSMHTNQHGGAYTPIYGAPVGDQGLLPQELRDIARITPLDAKSMAIVGLRDPDQTPIDVEQAPPDAPDTSVQTGGRRCWNRKGRKGRKSRKARKGGRKARSTRKVSKGRKMRGGSYRVMGASYDAPTMLLTPDEAKMAGTGDFDNPLLQE